MKIDIDIASLRKEYKQAHLDEQHIQRDPLEQFRNWFQEAVSADVEEPNAMGLATVSSGKPSLRIVLLKGLDEKGFIFFTNYDSRKGKELAANPHAALTFFWTPLERQVRIEGTAEKISLSESEAYFHSRGKGSQIGAWASPQSQAIPDRAYLEERVKSFSQQFESQEEIPKPDYWGGYRLIPTFLEFWQGRPSRLHDRIAFTLMPEGNWKMERLAP